ncbi:MAG: aspartate kinase, partial [Clostridia bacterium]|nr:aspartate kinase [Clostridia bacterium]
PAISLLGWQIGMQTDSNYGNARIKKIDSERLSMELSRRNIIIVAGFQGINKYDDITTLGRGGSDTTAVAIAATLKADLCQIYTDVDGVYTADPRKVTGAKKLDVITYDEMLELATLGAQVLHNRSVEMAKKYNVNMEVCSSLERVPGTKVKEVVTTMEKMLIRGVAKDNNVARVTIVGIADVPGMAYKIFSVLSQAKINVDIILQSIGRDGSKDIVFTVSADQKDEVVEALKRVECLQTALDVKIDTDVAKVSIVGAGMESHPGVASQMFEALFSNNINIQMIATSEIKISVLIDKKDADRAVQAVHDMFFDK